jgi:hypothetical protein
MTPLHPDREHLHETLRSALHLIVYAKGANAKLPRSKRVSAHGLSIPRLNRRLVKQLPPDSPYDNGALTNGQHPQGLLRLAGILDAIAHTPRS